MALRIDPEIADSLMNRLRTAAIENLSMPARGDTTGLRTMIDQGLRESFRAIPEPSDVSMRDRQLSAADGGSVRIRLYVRESAPRRGPVVVYAHGGGRVCGNIEIYDKLVRHYVSVTGVPFVSVAYRRAPEFKSIAAPEDCLTSLRWLRDLGSEFGIDPSRIALMGDSGGGGVAAGAAILARDCGVSIAKQILIYPMLDDRTTVADPQLVGLATWTYDNNFTGWHALLAGDIGGPDVSPVAAPSRLGDCAGLAPAYIEVGELDIFRDESVEYAMRLQRAGVSCELHVHPGAPHGYDWLGPDSALSRRAMERRIQVILTL